MSKSNRTSLRNDWVNTFYDPSEYHLAAASEDASFRSYYRLTLPNDSRIIMDAPPESENIVPFIEVAELLRKENVHTPRIYEVNLEDGFMMLEDLGNVNYLDTLKLGDADELYQDAFMALVKIQAADHQKLPSYNQTLLQQELDLFEEWFLGKHLGVFLDKDQQRTLRNICDTLIENALEQPTVVVHRDYHSRNLMKTSRNNPGVIDFQDAVAGPISYDLVSLLKDCYIKWPLAKIHDWVDRYRELQPHTLQAPRQQFIKWFDLMGMQRHLKVLGIFARLNYRDNKPNYLDDMPLTLSYILEATPNYPETAPLADLFEQLNLQERLSQ